MWWNMAAVGLGASAGALLRWGLGNLFAKTLSWVALGILAANLLGGLLIGMLAALMELSPTLSPQWRLLLITGFLGGLTTFSSFSLEIAVLLQQQRWLWALAIISLHVVGSVAMTLLGMALVHGLK